ncbi:MAG: phosphatidylglycerophosphatase A [Alphaproteobacteria bacterium]|nr:phosphatidylglycerophosphatase A [Alphaproteobacteria bacterium]
MSFKDKCKPGIKPLPDGTTIAHPLSLIATWFGSGRLRPAPGTMGTIAALPFGYAIAAASGPLGLFIASVVMLLIGTVAASYYGRHSGLKDDQSIVVDEVVGVWIAAIPAGTDLQLWLLAFILFRIFDIYKPWPASYFDKKSRGGFDVMMDDVVAGIYAFPGVATMALAHFN